MSERDEMLQRVRTWVKENDEDEVFDLLLDDAQVFQWMADFALQAERDLRDVLVAELEAEKKWGLKEGLSRAIAIVRERKMTNARINQMAAGMLGLCGSDDPVNEDGNCTVCRGKRYDFCNDWNVVIKLVKKATANGNSLFPQLRELVWSNATLDWRPSVTDVLKLPPRTITLACLVAMGKITLEEAKDG